MGNAVFISYRRAHGASAARLISKSLAELGYAPILDVDSFGGGELDREIQRQIAGAEDLVAILTPDTLEDSEDAARWVERELSEAEQSNKNVVPVLTEGFDWPVEDGHIPTYLAKLKSFGGVKASHDQWEGSVSDLTRKLTAKPKHRLSLALILVTLGVLVAAFALGWYLSPLANPHTAWFHGMVACAKARDTAESMSCLRKQLHVGTEGDVADEHYRAQVAGWLALSTSPHDENLERMTGIQPEFFIGTGFAVPIDKPTHQAHLKEYLAPNLHDSRDNVWTWILEPSYAKLRNTIQDVLESELPDPASDQGNWEQVGKSRVLYADKATLPPPLLRIHQISEKRYKNGKRTVGHPDRQRVFFADLNQAKQMTVSQFFHASGATLGQPGKDDKIFIWVFRPTNAQEAVPATWQEVMKHATEWFGADED